MAKKKKKILKIIMIIAVILLVLGGLIGFALMKINRMITSPVGTTYGKAGVEDLATYVNVSGSVSGSNAINVTAAVDQKVTKLCVKVGDAVREGDILCEFDDSELQERFDKLAETNEKNEGAEDYQAKIRQRDLNDAKREKNTMMTQAQQAINDAEAARNNAYNRYNTAVNTHNQMLAQLNALPPEDTAAYKQLSDQIDGLEVTIAQLRESLPEYDSAVKSAYDSYNNAVEKGNTLVQSAQDAIDAKQYAVSDDSVVTNMKELQKEIDSCVVKAPADGVITQLNLVEGSIPMDKNLMVIENTSDLVIRGKVREDKILQISEGMKCEIKTTATDDKTIAGTVQRIERIMSASADGNSGFAVEISVDDPDSELLIGMSANVKIILDKKEKVLSVPYDAVVTGENDEKYVYVLEPGSTEGMRKVVKKTVETGFEGDYYTEITKGDIKEGDYVVTEAIMFAGQDGMEIPDPTLTDADGSAKSASN